MISTSAGDAEGAMAQEQADALRAALRKIELAQDLVDRALADDRMCKERLERLAIISSEIRSISALIRRRFEN